MCKTKLFHELLNMVSVEMEISLKEIKDKKVKTTEVVDARSILVYLLHEQGFYANQISVLMERTPANIRKLLSDFEIRKQNCKMIEIHLKHLQDKLLTHTQLADN